MENYIGHPHQVRGVEQYTLRGGRGEGMNMLCVRNGKGLEAWISLDRCGDLSRVTFKGDNMGYFAPCGYVAPQYYDDRGAGFLKSFTAGFFTTCGLCAVGSPCTDEGEELPLHGTIGNIPAEAWSADEDGDELTITVTVRDGVIFGRKLLLKRVYKFSYTDNTVTMTDTVKNEGDTQSPYMILYHCNMGYPLLSENSEVNIPAISVTPRNEHAAEFIESALKMEVPQTSFEERCYYHDVVADDGVATVSIYNSDIDRGVVMSYDKNALPYFTEWKMMGKRDYVLGLEPGNCTPDGRDVMRKNGTLQFIDAGESKTTGVKFEFVTKK